MSNDVQEIEISIEQARAAIDLGNALERLMSNADFQALIMKGYFQDEAVRLVKARANPQLARPEIQAEILRSIDAISVLYQYFNRIDVQADIHEDNLRQYMEELAHIDSEGEAA